MNEEHVDGGQEMSSDDTARRKFLKRSSGVAIAVPAAVLLLAAHSKVAQARPYGEPPA